jgi:L-aminopeptidase/D-esterase-like protein
MVDAITDIPGIRVGHAHDEDGLSGCTVVLAEAGAVGGIDQRGGAPGTRETDALQPMHLITHIHAVMLAGGSAFGLDAASGAVRYLEERGIGYNTGFARVPIVPAAILFDLGIGSSSVRPTAEMGYAACQNARSDYPGEGNVGAGIGATVGKFLGMQQAMKSGIGTASLDLGGGVRVGAIVAVNAFGDVVDPLTGQILAGTRCLHTGPIQIGSAEPFANTLELMRQMAGRVILSIAARQNTVIGVVATNARLSKEHTNKVAQMAQDGIARSIRPAHTMLDGDTIFALSTGRVRADVNIVGSFAAEVVSRAITNAVRKAQSAGGLPAMADLARTKKE